MKENQNQIALITGGNRGLGLQTARELGHLGILTVLGVRDPKKGASAVKQLESEGCRAEAVRLDVSDPSTYDEAYAHLESHGKLDILVNNAGIREEGGRLTGDGPKGDPGKSPAMKILRETFETNFFGTVALTERLLPLIRKAPAGRIVNLSSIAYELRGTPIKVNSAHPGWVRTDMGGAGADLDISEGAKTSVWLATLPADGPTGGYFHMKKRLPW